MKIRGREPSDVPDCVELMYRTHQHTGYPVHWPDRPAEFLASTNELSAWVAVDLMNRAVGHVALHEAEGDPAFRPVHLETGKDSTELAVVARLIVDPNSQGQGIGRALLATAVDAAAECGRQAILDVVASSTAAIAFYEAQQWQRVGALEIELPGNPNLSTWIYAAPGVLTDGR